ncbi:MAG: asparagine synthase (glutamine-hydrolyzing) [Myxococcota bacterium]
MCGVVGVWHLDGRPVDATALGAMRDTLTHRGPDDAGLWLEGPVGLGHRRLSILDLSEAGRMPMASPDGTIRVVFNGEVYNYRELRQELHAHGHQFHSDSDSEVVVRAYEQWGVDSFDRFNGMFAVVIWDANRDTMVLARDAAGQKPLYYAYRPANVVLVGSTLAPLIRYAGPSLEVDRDAVQDYVRFGYPTDGKAMLRGVQTVPPGCYTVIPRGEAPKTHRYFDLVAHAEHTEHATGDEDELVGHFRDLMRDAVRARLVSDVPLGAFLSGGVDSSLVVALMAEQDPQAVKTYTIGFDDPVFDESPAASRIARHLGVQNTVRTLRGHDVLGQLSDVIRFFDEPMADYSVLPGLAVSKLAREHVTVALTGDGADEEFGGYRYYLAQQLLDPYFRYVPRPGRRLASLAGPLVPGGGARRILQRSASADAQTFFGLGGFYRGATATAVDRLLGDEGVAAEKVASFLRAHPLQSVTEAGMLYDATHTLPGAWLYKVDRASMAVGLEARSPFLDRRVLEFAFSLPMHLRLRGQQKKYIVRRLLREYLPGELVDRPKQGFTAPVAAWLRQDLRDELHTRLGKSAVERRGFFDSTIVSRMVHEHLDDSHDHAQLLWALLILEWWLTHHIDGKPVEIAL